MRADELDTDAALVDRLLAAQFPRWAGLPIVRVESAGTDNAIYRLGDALAVRLPRIHWATGQPELEREWLPRLAPHLPLAVPVPLATGEPGEGYPWRWSVVPWLPGENASAVGVDPREAAADLARFVLALQRIDTRGAPAAGRGVPLVKRDAPTRAAIEELRGLPELGLDLDAVTAAWETALRAPAWDGPPVWLHGDLQAGNLLAVEGRLSAVIDFGCLGVGDPACDSIFAWNFLSAETRDAYREALDVDDATWDRGRGWALSVGLIALPYYRVTNPVLADIGRHAIDEVLADHAATIR